MRLSFLRMVPILAVAALAVVAGTGAPTIAHAQTYGPATTTLPAGAVVMPLGTMPVVSTTNPVVSTTVPVVSTTTTTPVAVTTQPVYPVVAQSTTGTTDSPPDNCNPYDSWCAYCTYHAGADVCAAYPPGHKGGTTGASSGTPGVGSPSTTPAGSSPAPVGGGGTSGGGGYPTPGR